MDKPHISVFTSATEKPIARFLFAHGAGAGMDSDFMVDMAKRLASCQIEVLRFNFAYMQIMSETGKRRPPNRMPQLLEDFLAQVNAQPTQLPLFIGGKSMGGRAATLLASQEGVSQNGISDLVSGVVALGYPFHPNGKPDKLRIDHLPQLHAPCLIVQGERDTMGNKTEVASYDLPNTLELVFMPDGDHSLKPRKASGVSLEDNLCATTQAMVSFIKGLI